MAWADIFVGRIRLEGRTGLVGRETAGCGSLEENSEFASVEWRILTCKCSYSLTTTLGEGCHFVLPLSFTFLAVFCHNFRPGSPDQKFALLCGLVMA